MPANYMNQLIDPFAGSRRGFQNIMATLDSNRENALAKKRDERAQTQFDVSMMAVPFEYTKIKTQHVRDIAKNIMALPQAERSKQYSDLVNKVVPTPLATHPQLGPLGAADPGSFVSPDEFVKMTDEQQKAYLGLVSSTADELARINLQDKMAAQKEKEIGLQAKNRLEEIRLGKQLEGENQIALQNAKNESLEKFGASAFTQEEIDLMGATYNLKGQLPAMGRGKEAAALRQAVLKSAAQQALGSGKGASDIVSTQSDVKAMSQSLNMQEKQFGAMGSFVRNLDAQIKKVKELSNELKTFDTRLLNIPLRMVRAKIKGSPEQAKYDMYLTEIESEIGKLATGSTASVSELSVGAQEKWNKIHDKNLSIKDMLSLLEETNNAGKMRMKSVEDQLSETRKRMRSLGFQKTQPNEQGGQPEVRTLEQQPGMTGPMTAEDYLKKLKSRMGGQ